MNANTHQVLARLGYGLTLGVAAGLLVAVPGLTQTRSPLNAPANIVKIGDSAAEQQFYQRYWDTLIQSSPLPAARPSATERPVGALPRRSSYDAIARNLRVRDLKLARITQRPLYRGSRRVYSLPKYGYLEPFSELGGFGRPFSGLNPHVLGQDRVKVYGPILLTGKLSNWNDFPVTVSAVNYKIVNRFGDLVQTGSVYPEPQTILPRQTVTVQQRLFDVPFYGGYEVKLLNPAFILDEPVQ